MKKISTSCILICLTSTSLADNTLISNFNKTYPQYKIYNSCNWTLPNGKEKIYGMSVINPKNGNVKYIAYIKSASGKYQTVNLANFKYKPTQNGIEDTPEVKCFSATELKKLIKTIDNSEGIHSDLNPIANSGAICIYSDNATFSCFSLEKDTKNFINIGGWIT